ncbi:uncharacterized protein [Epargyreus clarus]|uniref:uncharacterized protein n=1 Tax=Epargyreus clarus TaxID=520877 RepID=UPI003C2F4FF4
MNTSPDNIIVNSCQYTPVYLIENPGVSETRSYIITQNDQIGQRPVSENLKKFYENSGKLENNLFEPIDTNARSRLVKKQEGNVIGNNLKLASFLIPKNETPKQHAIISNNVVLKPVVLTNSSSVVHTTPQLDINRKIVKIKDIPKTFNHSKILPKNKPKENPANPSKHTSVQLLKLGETYHSLNELSDDQMKIVNHALKIFSNPEKTQEPTYDPVTNTRYIYKVVSPKDLTVVGNKNKVIFKHNKNEIRKELYRKVEKKETKQVQEEEEQSPVAEAKVTRSGRKVKLPKNILPEETPQKPRKKSGTIVSCFQCSTEFSSLYRLQRHYENHPTHIPARIHSNLFHCLLAIIKGGSEEDGANILVQQLEQLIAKLKSLLPCLLTKSQGIEGRQSTISDDVGRLFGMEPGKYSLNMDALSCVKNKDGYCRHNPQPNPQPNNKLQTPNNFKDEIEEVVIDTDDCARITSAEKWPTVSKRLEGRKIKQEVLHNKEDSSAKKMKLAKEPESQIDMGMDDIVAFLNSTDKTKIKIEPATSQSVNPLIDENSCDVPLIIDGDNSEVKITKPPHVQFHSAHFDIRSSPIKPSSTVFRKFKIDPDKIARYEPQIIRPPALNTETSFSIPAEEVTEVNSSSMQAHELFNENISIPSKDTGELAFDTSKTWSIADQPDYLKVSTLICESTDSYIKPSSLIEPALLHIKDPEDKTATNEPNHNHEINDLRLMPTTSQSVFTFLDSLGNSVDYQLDLFS